MQNREHKKENVKITNGTIFSQLQTPIFYMIANFIFEKDEIILKIHAKLLIKARLSECFDTFWPSEHFPSNSRQWPFLLSTVQSILNFSTFLNIYIWV